MRKLSSPGIRLRRPKTKDPKPSKKGQAAALDLAVFISICILALSYLFIQSIQTSASAEFIQENENVNEVAIRALSELADSSGGDLEIKTVQPIALKNVSSCLSNDIQRIMGIY